MKMALGEVCSRNGTVIYPKKPKANNLTKPICKSGCLISTDFVANPLLEYFALFFFYYTKSKACLFMVLF